jgi:hypothetical protein
MAIMHLLSGQGKKEIRLANAYLYGLHNGSLSRHEVFSAPTIKIPSSGI